MNNMCEKIDVKKVSIAIHHIATIISVISSSIFLKEQKKKRKSLLLFLILQCYGLFKIVVYALAKENKYQKSFCHLEELFKKSGIQKCAVLFVVMIGGIFKIGVPFLLKK